MLMTQKHGYLRQGLGTVGHSCLKIEENDCNFRLRSVLNSSETGKSAFNSDRLKASSKEVIYKIARNYKP